jgi:hypothetical protein
VGIAARRNDARGMKKTSLLAFALVVFASSPCSAEEPKPKTTWYGWQTLLVDGGTVAATLATQEPLVYLGGMTLGSPIVHWAHGNVLQGFASLGVRVIAPIVIASAAFALESGPPTDGRESQRALGVGLLGGGLFASVLDSVVLAREPRRD